jgi:hypothetical protein
MSAQQLALVVVDDRLGYNVVDTRCGRPISWHGDLHDANGIAAYLNATYPMGADHLSSDKFCAPARDTLIFEVLTYRVGGEEPRCIETWWLFNQLGIVCPAVLPTGPGWDHIYEEVQS